MKQPKRIKRYRRHKRVKAKIKGTVKIPRLCVFRSNKHIYGQLIDDEKGKTLVVASDLEIKSSRPAGQKSKIANLVGELLAKKALEKKIDKVIFDRGGYKYHGRVKSLAEGARKGGLKF
ncbi:MAG: 50S ribosomal protein L18 [Patescibacteria group bacterium]